MDKTKKTYAVYWDEKNQGIYLNLTDTEYENIIKVLQITEVYDVVITSREIDIKEF